MFFIVNYENSIIAADTDFLEEVGAHDIYEAAQLIKNGKVQLDENEGTITYLQQNSSFSKTLLSSFLGDAYLYEIKETEIEEECESPNNDEIFNLTVGHEAPLEIAEENENSTLHTEETEPTTRTETDELDETWPENTLSLAAPEKENDEPAISKFVETDTENETLAQDQAEENPDEKDDSLSLSKAIGLAGAGIAASTLIDEEDIMEDLQISDEPLILLKETDEEIPVVDEEKGETDAFQEEDQILSLIETPSEHQETDKRSYDEELFNLAVTDNDSTEEKREKEETDESSILNEVTPQQEDTGINIKGISELIGVSEEEYKHFLEDFRKESSGLESHLRSNDLRESREAISILKEASLLLHLPHITEKLGELTNATSDEKAEIIESFLALVSETSMSKEADAAYTEADTISKHAEVAEDSMGMAHPEEIVQPEEIQEKKLPGTPLEDLPHAEPTTLEEVQAIPFDFSINEAADELTLPASLVSEFVIDFVNQAKENLPVLQKAYENSDLDTLQKTAHMLKGASSNLRITPMADTLYNLQFNDDLSQVPELIKLFTGQLKALSIQMDQVS